MEQNNYATRWQQAVQRPSEIAWKMRAILRSSFLSVASFMNRSENDSYLRCLCCHYVFDDQREDFDNERDYAIAIAEKIVESTKYDL